MGKRLTVRVALASVAALLALTALAPSASAQTDLRGHWSGFSEHGTINPGPPHIDTSFFDVFTQARGRFQGSLEIESEPEHDHHPFPVAGFVLPNGTLFGSGTDSNGHAIAITGRARAVIDPNQIIDPNLAPVMAMSLLYAVRDRLGNLMETGVTVHIQMQGGLNWINPGPPQVPDLSGLWEGDYLPRVGPGGGSLNIEVAQASNGTGGLTTSLPGSKFMENVFVPAEQSFFDITFDVQGTIGVPAVQRDGSLAAPFGALGVCPFDPSRPGIIALIPIAKYTPPDLIPGEPGIIRGQYRLYDSFFDVFTEIALDGNTAFDQGSFSIQQRPPRDPPPD